MKGYIQLYTGNGKGKTTAAFGLALRATGAGKKVLFTQFAKGRNYSETDAVQKYIPAITIKQYGLDCFIINQPTPEDIDIARKGIMEISEVISTDKYDMIVFDEATIAIYYHLFTADELIEVINKKKEETEIVITGRYAPEKLIEFADLVTEMKEVKHYYNNGVEARKGIEY